MKKIILLPLFLLIAQWCLGQTASVVDPHANNGHFAVFNNKLYFSADHGQGYELWVFDGITAPSLVADINQGNGSSNPRDLTVFNNKLYFQAEDGISGAELWVYDGITAPSLVADINPGSGSSSPFFFTIVNNKLYFAAIDGIHGKELWVYDGITAPSLVADIRSGSNHSLPWDLTAFNNKLYFQANDGIRGQELWVYDGITAPSVIDIRPGSSGSGSTGFTVFNNKLYFTAYDVTHGFELWVYDGITAPSVFADIRPGSSGSNPNFCTVFNNKLYFQADDGIHGKELWVYDGITAPSVIDIRPGIASSSPGYFAVLNNKLYFDVRGYSTALWVYDDVNGASAVAGTTGTTPTYLTPFNNKLYFRGKSGAWVLWEYNPNPPPTIIHVDQNATGSNDGTSWANAFTNLQEGIDLATAGEYILVAQGTYFPSKNSMGALTSGRDATYYINKDIIIEGGYPTGGGTRNPLLNQTILSGDLAVMADASDNAYHVLWLEGVSNSATLDGLIIQDGNADQVGYPNDRAAGIFNNGVSQGSSSPTFQNCIVRWNQADLMGGGMLNLSNYYGFTSPILNGCLFYENTSPNGAAIANATHNGGSNSMVITNCTFADNVGNSSIHNRHGNATITIQNSILWDDNMLFNQGNETIVQYSIIKSASLPTGTTDGGNNKLNINPLFIDTANDDYSLGQFSGATNAGANGLVVASYPTDLNANSRVMSGVVDMGAIESAGAVLTTVYVNAAAVGNNDGSSWADAFTKIEDAITLAVSGMEIWIAAGTYKPTTGTDRSIAFNFKDGVKVYGGFAGTEMTLSQRNWAINSTILSGDIGTISDASDNSYHVVRLSKVSNTTHLDGLIIQDGNANEMAYPNDRGAGIYNDGGNGGNSNPMLQNCIIRWNNANTMGGAMLNLSNYNGATSPSLIGCLVYENTSANGASIANTTYSGGSNNMLISNSTFADNVGGSSIYNPHGNASITIQNSIVWDDNAVYNYGNETTVQYSSVKGASLASGTTNGGNNQLATNPLFVDAANDDYRLQAASSAIEAGNSAYVSAAYTLDLAHNTRQTGTTVEMGCYEDVVNPSRPTLVQNEESTNSNTASEEETLAGLEEKDASSIDIATAATMTVYPNPVQDIVHLNLKDANQQATVRLLSTTGQVLIQEQVQADAQTVLQLNMGRLAKGMYLLNVQLEDGTQLKQRVVKF